MSRFPHDPTVSREAAGPEHRATLRDARERGQPPDMLLTRHDGVLVVEVADAIGRDGNVREYAQGLYERLGATYAELVGPDVLRYIYDGELPEAIQGGDPVVVDLPGEPRARMYDSGHVPMTWARPDWAESEPAHVDRQNLEKVLRYARVIE